GASRTRNSDSVVFESAEYNGFKAAWSYTTKATTAAATQYATAITQAEAISDLGLFYTNGPLAAGLSQYEQKAAVKHTTGFVSYTLGAAKVTYGFHTNTNQAGAVQAAAAGKIEQALGKSKGSNIALDYTLTPTTTLMANIARLNDSSALNQDLSLSAVGVKYALSKRTSLNARFISEKRDNAGTATSNIKDLKTTLLGLQHNF
ncbi:porin, partial [Flavobacterium sp.]|uniref:porin n=1 Tax=Flavobacterium sp. TaxID=239 RepID=UPI0037BEFFAB